MNNKNVWKSALVLGLLVISGIQIYPNFVWYSLPLETRHDQAKRKNPLAEKVLPLGLDLQGGIHLVYEMDTSKLPDESDAAVMQAIEQNILVINNPYFELAMQKPNQNYYPGIYPKSLSLIRKVLILAL